MPALQTGRQRRPRTCRRRYRPRLPPECRDRAAAGARSGRPRRRRAAAPHGAGPCRPCLGARGDHCSRSRRPVGLRPRSGDLPGVGGSVRPRARAAGRGPDGRRSAAARLPGSARGDRGPATWLPGDGGGAAAALPRPPAAPCVCSRRAPAVVAGAARRLAAGPGRRRDAGPSGALLHAAGARRGGRHESLGVRSTIRRCPRPVADRIPQDGAREIPKSPQMQPKKIPVRTE